MDIPAAAVASALKEQTAWDKDRSKRSGKEHHQKRYMHSLHSDARLRVIYVQEPAKEEGEGTS